MTSSLAKIIIQWETKEEYLQEIPKSLERLKEIILKSVLNIKKYCILHVRLQDGSELESEYQYLTLLERLSSTITFSVDVSHSLQLNEKLKDSFQIKALSSTTKLSNAFIHKKSSFFSRFIFAII